VSRAGGARGLEPSAVAASRDDGDALHDDALVEEWLERRRAAAGLRAAPIPLQALQGWEREPASGNLRHAGGRFFSVIGIHCRHRVDRSEIEWDQPIIEQPETGILGILARTIGGVAHFCLQAKEEPGNLGGVQLSPTVQATYSNYTRAHGGAAPRFLERFVAPDPRRILFARLQSEDGGRFLYKSNRNLIVDAGDDFPTDLPEGFIWLTLRQLAGLLRKDDRVNACARSVLSSLALPPAASASSRGARPSRLEEPCPAGIWETLQWLDDRRAANHVQARRIGLDDLREWRLDERGSFSHREGRFFRIIGLRVEAPDREVRSWSQPIIANAAPGIIGLLLRDSPRGREILMQAKAEPGNRTVVQLGPTVQFTPGNYAPGSGLEKPFLFDAFLDPGPWRLLHESHQAEEGARFFREHHLHRILSLPDGVELRHGDDYRWLPLPHVRFLLHLGDQVNSCARSVLACLL